MTDLITHILPGMKDGAASAMRSVELLGQEFRTGTYRVALTPRFDCRTESTQDFLQRRNASFAELKQYADTSRTKLRLKLGAEVLYVPELMQTDLRTLCLDGTDLLLLTLPDSDLPRFLKEALGHIQQQRMIPLIAHAERYTYVQNHPELLADWIELGALVQVDAVSLVKEGRRKKLALDLLRWRLTQVVSSSVSDSLNNPLCLSQAMQTIARELDSETAIYVQQTAAQLFEGIEPDYPEFHRPRHVLGRWV